MDYGRLTHAMLPDWLKFPPIFSEAAHKIRFRSRFERRAVWPIHDLILNDILLWLLPTHRRTHLIRFGVVLGALVGALGYNVSRMVLLTTATADTDTSTATQEPLQLILTGGLATTVIWWCYFNRRVLRKLVWERVEWMDPTVPARLRLPMHVPLRLFSDPMQARRAACVSRMVARNDSNEYNTENVWQLDDLEWMFCYNETAEEGLAVAFPKQFAVASKTATSAWSPMPVPSNWTLQGFDKPIYTNMKYPWPCEPPLVPHQNPTGVCKLVFDLPPTWNEDNALDSSDFTIIFHGVESAYFVQLNDQFIGFSKDSRLPGEFDVTPALRPTGNTLQVVVLRWSDGSYVEDQDQWWMAGIHRSVELVRRPAAADILDYAVQADASGHISINVDCRRNNDNERRRQQRRVKVELYDDDQIDADGDAWRKGQCVWSASHELKADNKGFSVLSCNLSGDLPTARLWTAETPNLYTLVVTLEVAGEKGAAVTVTQAESCRVGFRSVDIHDGAVHVNGKRITVCGMNRHEHDPDRGKVLSLERMKQDICLLK